MAVNIQNVTDYLLQHKTLSMEKIGTISINNSATSSEEAEQAGSTIFVFDKRAETSESLYTYIAELQQKNINVVRSDVDSFIEEMRQLMNIGSRPIHFEGIGYIFSDKNFGYKFSEHSPVGFKEPISVEAENGFGKMPNYNVRSRSNAGVKALLLFIILVLLGGIVYFIYSIMHKNEEALTEKIMVADSTLLAATNTTAALPEATENATSKFIIETTASLSRATNRSERLVGYGHKILVDTVENNGQKSYKLYLQIALQNPADTAHIRDSLTKYFGKKVIVEK